MGSERLTEELVASIVGAASPEAYLACGQTLDRDLPDYLAGLLARSGMPRAQAIRRAGLGATFGYQVFQGTRRPGRDHAIMLALGLGCDLRETGRLLRLAGASQLSPKCARDAVVIWCVSHGLDRERTDDELWRLGERTLLDAGR